MKILIVSHATKWLIFQNSVTIVDAVEEVVAVNLAMMNSKANFIPKVSNLIAKAIKLSASSTNCTAKTTNSTAN